MSKAPEKHSGFVAILGRPNVGKSTLLNEMIGEKIAAVSRKPQTTRGPVRGILTRDSGQIVFLDTPGLHDPRDLLGGWMMKEAEKSLDDADLLYWMVLPGERHPYDDKILELVKKTGKPAILIVNQIDKYPKLEILPVLEYYFNAHPFKELIPISAKTGEQVQVLIQKTFEYLPAAPYFFPADQLSDQSERFIIAEMIREKLFQLTEQEIPYSTAVMIESFKERNENMIDIEATIVVEKDSQKAIVIGKKGDMLKRIGLASRLNMEKFLGKKVFLKTWVKTVEHWKTDKAALRRLGYE